MLVKEYMTSDVITVSEDINLFDAIAIMKKNNIRRLPVIRNDRIVGIVTDSDLRSAAPSQVLTLVSLSGLPTGAVYTSILSQSFLFWKNIAILLFDNQ